MIRLPESSVSFTHFSGSSIAVTSSSIGFTYAGAPPCSGPESAPTADESAAPQSAPVEATMRAANVEYYSAVVLDVAEVPPPLAPAMFACSRVAGWSAHILEQKRTGRLFRPSATYIGPAPRSLAAVS